MNTKVEIQKMTEDAVNSMKKDWGGFQMTEVLIERPEDQMHGDYATNIALLISKELKKNPLEVAKTIANKIKRNNKVIDRIEVAPPGFINFYLSREFFINSLREILKYGDYFGRNRNLANKKVAIEYTDPNPFKEFHIGHLMSNSIGESLSRILEFQGAEVKRFCYQGDVGLHVAKAVFGLIKLKNNNTFPKDNDMLKGRMKFLGMAYTNGSLQYEKDESAKKEIDILNKKIFEGSDREVNKFYDKGKVWSLEYFSEIYKKLGTDFDYFIFESQVFNWGRKIVEDGLKKGIFEKSQGAIIFKGEKYGLHTRVFINSENLPTYEAKELGLAYVKSIKYPHDQSFVVTGNEINEYFKVMLCAMGQVLPSLAKKTKHIGHGMMRLPEGKMSSRTGNIVTFELLLSQLENMVMEKVKDKNLALGDKKEIAEKVSIGAIKYAILKQSIGSDIIYNLEKSVSFEGDSGPYLQYSYTRAKSVLNKAMEENITSSFKDKNIPSEVSQLEKTIHYFTEIVEKAGKEQDPHFIVSYLTDLAREFNGYYEKNKIIDKQDESSQYKVALTQAFSIIMKNGLWLLGIPLPDRL